MITNNIVMWETLQNKPDWDCFKTLDFADDLDNVDFVSSNVHSSRKEALLKIFEDNEAVITMIIKGKKPCNETCFQNPQSCS